VASLFAGCLAIVPVPPDSADVRKGRKIEHSDVGFIVPGVTTRREVEHHLGPSTRHCDHPPASAYLWETPPWTMYWWVAVPDAAFSDNFLAGGGRYVFFIAFDDRGIVRKCEFRSLSQRGSLDDKLELWAKRDRHRKFP